jgi:1-deoxy-D-xylulose-5-phosphate synthase
MTLPVLNIGLPDSFIEHGTREQCLQYAGLDSGGVQKQIDTFLIKFKTGAAA